MNKMNKKINLIILIILTTIITSCDQNIGKRQINKAELIGNK